MQLIAAFLKCKNIFFHSWTGKALSCTWRVHLSHKPNEQCVRRCLHGATYNRRGSETVKASSRDRVTELADSISDIVIARCRIVVGLLLNTP